MSRRKQSNPKPIKRQAGEDGSDSEMANHLDAKKVEENMDQSNASLSSDEENKPREQNDIKNIVHCQVEGPREITSPYDNSTSFPNGIWKNNLFPSDVLSLRKVEESEFIQTGIAWSILANIALQKGSTIGPYRGELVSLSSIKPGQLVLQGPSGEFAFIKVMEEGGEWLTLLKPADRQMAHNTSVYFEEGRIWCEMVLDLAAGTELVASFTVNGERQSSSPEGEKSSSPSSVSPCETATIKEEPKSSSPKATPKAVPETRSSAHFKSVIIPPNHAALIYGCPFCGVRFSSARTLEAHLSFYCSKKPPDFVSIQQQLSQQHQQATGAASEKEPEAINKDNFGKESPADVDKEKTSIKKEPELSTNKRSAEQKSNDFSDSASESESPPAKSPKTGQLYKCPLCSYTADKVSSLNRHRRIHNRGGDDVVEKLPVVLSSHSDMFCKDCNIQFSSMNTYRAHKEFYCKGRQKVGQDQSTDGNSSGEESPKAQDSPQVVTPTSQAMATLLASNPALLASNQQLLQQMALIPHPFLLGNPEVISLASQMTRPVIPHGMQGFMKSPDEATSPINQISPGHNSDKSKLSESKNLMELSSQDVPLDLSTCKPKKISESFVESDENSEQPENLVIKKEPKSPSPGPSQNVLDTKSPPKTQSLSSGDGTGTVQVPSQIPLTAISIPGLMTPVLPFNQIQFVKNKPIPTRQPVSRCVECNIVFYKHENFLIHKEHYCSGRQIKDTTDENMVTADENRKQESPDSSPKADLLTCQAQYKENPHPKTIPVPSPNQIVTTPKTPTEICYRYYCIPCKIKFSSAGTLKAHKEFYCPHGQATETLVVKEPVENESNTSSPNSSEEGNSFKCSTCQSEFMSARLLKLHFCNGSATQTPLLRCPYCDYVTQTETRLSEHMKVHIPTKAFKCTICGYRGNTARGMRMHGKMHIDNGEEFTDDNMVEYEEPPLIPVQRNGVCDKGPVDVESELIRLKNEPYKRRRSRKSFEKTENFSAFLNHAVLPRVCAACGQTFTDVNSFLIHLQMHEMAALEAVKSLKCEHCNFVAESLKNLLQHLHAKHPEQLPTTSKPSSASPNRSENGERSRSPMRSDSGDDRSDSGESSNSHSSLCENSVRKEKPFAGQNGDFKGKTMNLPLKISLKEEIISNESSSDDESKILKIKKEPDDRNSPSPRQCTAVNSKVNRSDEKDLNPKIYDNSEQVSPGIQDQKYSPKISIPSQNFSTGLLSPRESSPREPSPRQPSPRQAMTPILPNISSIKREPMSPKLQFDCEPNATVKSESKSPTSLDRSPLKLRTHSSPTTSPKLPTTKGILTATMIQNFPLYNPALLSLYQLPGVSHGVTPLVSMPALTPSSIVPPSVSGAISPDKQGPKYCKDCDIKFTYLSTFLTHKKFYCRARTGGDLSHSATA